jgi:hypothetical protein
MGTHEFSKDSEEIIAIYPMGTHVIEMRRREK